MSKIICKAKNHEGVWVYGWRVKIGKVDNIVKGVKTEEGIYTCRWEVVDPETICAYSGVNDKNKVKIFEGDKVVVSEKHGYKESFEGLCTFYKGCFFVTKKDENGKYIHHPLNKKHVTLNSQATANGEPAYLDFEFEVVGNKHDEAAN